jgi:hypothetical protein
MITMALGVFRERDAFGAFAYPTMESIAIEVYEAMVQTANC